MIITSVSDLVFYHYLILTCPFMLKNNLVIISSLIMNSSKCTMVDRSKRCLRQGCRKYSFTCQSTITRALQAGSSAKEPSAMQVDGRQSCTGICKQKQPIQKSHNSWQIKHLNIFYFQLTCKVFQMGNSVEENIKHVFL